MIEVKRNTDTLTAAERVVVRALTYYDVFHYPLTTQEIFQNACAPNLKKEALPELLKELKTAGMLFEDRGFWQLEENPERIDRRIAGNERADKLMEKAYKKSKFIGAFPWVRGVYLSGSISKGFVSEDADIDYFIITKPGRLWAARTLLIAYKKVFLLNSYKYFCLNYFIDTEHLVIEEQNQFTATELVTLIPGYGKDLYHEFKKANAWADEFMPNYGNRSVENIPETRVKGFKKFLEWMFNNGMGRAFDSRCMKITLKFWKKKFSHFDSEDFKVAMKSRSYVSKHHPNHFQTKVLDAYKARITAFEESFNVSLNS